MLRAAAVIVVALAWAAPAQAKLAATVAPASGRAPLSVTLSAEGVAGNYHWDFGDGTSGDGATISHTYAAGAWTATVTAAGEQAQVSVTSWAISLRGAASARYGRLVAFTGTLTPPRPGQSLVLERGTTPVARATSRADGTFLIRTRALAAGPYSVRTADATSDPVTVRLHPQLTAVLRGPGVAGTPLALVARLRPTAAGTLRVRVWRESRLIVDRAYGASLRLPLATARVGEYRVRVTARPAEGYFGSVHLLRRAVVLPRLAPGAAGPSVTQLVSRLRELHYVAPRTAAVSPQLLDGVYAFQKVQGLPRTGIVDARTWRALARPRVPIPRYAGPVSHLEVDKARQVLYVVRGGAISLIVPVSTAGLAGYFTPLGRFAIYRKVAGWDSGPLGSLFAPMYFTGGYAIHGYPSVPPYPASHGCVRVPLWVAPMLYATNPYGEAVYVY